METIYLDNNATTAMSNSVITAIADVYRSGLMNPASHHQMGREARRLVEQCREDIGGVVGVHQADIHADHVIFTSGGTEANNLALQGICGIQAEPGRLVLSGIEHPSVSSTGLALKQTGWDLQTARTLANGQVDLDDLASLVNADTRLVSVMLANNETGVVQPLSEVVAICAEHGSAVHTDAVQAIGKLAIDFQLLGVDTMSISAHKMHGPCSIGALVALHNCTLAPLFYGGFQQTGIRPGTESVALAVGFSKALSLYVSQQESHFSLLSSLQRQLEEGVQQRCPTAVVIGQGSPRLPHTSCIAFPGIDRQVLVMALDVAGVCCSTGSACSSGSSEASPVLLAMGLADDVVEGAVRFSVSIFNTPDEIDRAVEVIAAVIASVE